MGGSFHGAWAGRRADPRGEAPRSTWDHEVFRPSDDAIERFRRTGTTSMTLFTPIATHLRSASLPARPPSTGARRSPDVTVTEIGGPMSTVAVVGAGAIGSTVAGLAVANGWQVVISNSRGPDTLEPLVARLGAAATAATIPDAVDGADLVVVAVPVRAYAALPVLPFRDHVVVDTGNYSPDRDGDIPSLRNGTTTVARMLADRLGSATVVKTFNTIHFEHLAVLGRPGSAPDRSALPLATDDPAARDTVTGFLDSLGFDVVDIGGLDEEWRIQPGRPAFGSPYAGGSADLSEAIAVPADTTTVRRAVAAATL